MRNDRGGALKSSVLVWMPAAKRTVPVAYPEERGQS
jgi:hypothetical protein